MSEPIASALFGTTRQAVLGLLFEHADERFYLRQIIRDLGLGSGAVQRELRRLTRSGILTRSVEGRQTYYQANRESPVFEDLHGLIRKTFGMAGILRAGLASLAGQIRVAFIYGSTAVGSDTADSDVDVMVIGDKIGMRDVVRTLQPAQRSLRREVNPSVYCTDEFCRKLAAEHHFVSSIVAGAKMFLIGGDRELAELAQIWLAQTASDQRTDDYGASSGSIAMSCSRTRRSTRALAL